MGKERNAIVAYCSKKFEKVILETNEIMKDYWFVWPEDFEPVRITFNGKSISSAMHRLHWIHIQIPNPYTDGKSRIETFFAPFSNTPIVRRTKSDPYFRTWATLMPNTKIEDYEVCTDLVPEYYKTIGKKDKHPPSVNYEGWPQLE